MIGNVQKKWFLLIPVLLVFSAPGTAQIIKGKTNKSIAEQAIVDLRDGALVLRLTTYHNKITKLEELLAKPDMNEKDRKRLEKDLETTIRERDQYNTELVASFGTHYRFSAVYFMHDTSSVLLKSGKKSGFLLDQNLKIDPNITITQDSFFVIYSGTLEATNSSGMEALIIMDSRFEVLPSPFPYYVKTNNFWLVLGRIFSSKNSVKREAQKVVPELNRKLISFYKLTTDKLSNSGIPAD